MNMQFCSTITKALLLLALVFPTSPNVIDPYTKKWDLVFAGHGPLEHLNEVDFPKGRVHLEFKNGSDGFTYSLMVQASNTFTAGIKVIGKVGAYDKISVGPVSSTTMVPSKDMQDIEKFISDNLAHFFEMRVDPVGNLEMTGASFPDFLVMEAKPQMTM